MAPITTSATAIVVDHNPATIAHIDTILTQAGTSCQTVRSTEAACRQLRTDPALSLVLVRFRGPEIDACELCRRIRSDQTLQETMILVIVLEDQLVEAAEALRAGATDVLLEPFEARELRIKANLSPMKGGRRVDAMHGVTAAPAAGSLPTGPLSGATLIAPVFDPLIRRFVHPAEPQLTGDEHQENGVTRVQLDRIMTCPVCGGLPTFRMGCPGCGSAWCEQETLIHHYACAHVGRESDFRHGSELRCPKCRAGGLVAGADFEVSGGGFVCADCGMVSSELQLIGHCLSCNYRFPARDAVIQQLTGYRVPERLADQLPPQPGGSRGGRRPLRWQTAENL